MSTVHRADYMLERGVWFATCRSCGFQVSDPQRRRAASQFRHHIREADTEIVDLTDISVACLPETADPQPA